MSESVSRLVIRPVLVNRDEAESRISEIVSEALSKIAEVELEFDIVTAPGERTPGRSKGR